ncbi:hypothetical protein PM8797T_23931 [Gimesia maris DSM 8797]|nr:hypothetical protein PM8797T_23931 [Gimesia maris DSM 8797]
MSVTSGGIDRSLAWLEHLGYQSMSLIGEAHHREALLYIL